MAEKIGDIASEAIKRLENEQVGNILSLVHDHFLPSNPLDLPEISFVCQSVLSQEYTGEWWHHQRVGDYVILFMGKIEGPSLSAAMLTAAAQGSISAYQNVVQLMPKDSVRDIKYLARYFNTAIHSTTQGKLKMNGFMGMFDATTGELQLVNASFLTPFLHRKDMGEGSEELSDHFEELRLKKNQPFGANPTFKVDVDLYRLQPGDMVFWYTPLILKTPNADGEVITHYQIFEHLLKLYQDCNGKAVDISAGMVEKLLVFFGEVGPNALDELMIGVVSIPMKGTKEDKKEA
jgi:serine phosphatase RsbU (regulator of sigma subunit)